MSRSKKRSQESYPKVVEVFGAPYLGAAVAHSVAPRVFNDVVHLRKYRITVEELAEPVEVLHERLRDMWDRCEDNMHTRQALRAAAVEIGLVLTGPAGTKAPPKERASRCRCAGPDFDPDKACPVAGHGKAGR